jgi:L-threonylcarbamoyladenylate synthase
MAIFQATAENIGHAARALAGGEVVAFPTETVYGLGANALDAAAVAKVFAAKERPRFNPLIVHVPGIEAAEAYAVVDDMARKLIATFWPGPLTLVLPRRHGCPIADLVSAGLETVALRSPSHPVARALLEAAKLPVAAPSANRSGRISPTSAADVEVELGHLPIMILDGGRSVLGLESTVLGFEGHDVVLLRPGALPREEFEALLGCSLRKPNAGGPKRSPGQLAVHYAPRTPVRLDTARPRPEEAFLTFGPEAPAFEGPTINLSPRGDVAEAAAKFFAALRSLDAAGAEAIAVMPIPGHGLGEAINDRLRRAAAARGARGATAAGGSRSRLPAR